MEYRRSPLASAQGLGQRVYQLGSGDDAVREGRSVQFVGGVHHLALECRRGVAHERHAITQFQPPRSSNLNAFTERFVRSIKKECLSRMIFFGPASLQHAVRQFMAHYHTERNHQGLENRLPQPASVTALPHHPVQRRRRLGGMLSYYHRAAA